MMDNINESSKFCDQFLKISGFINVISVLYDYTLRMDNSDDGRWINGKVGR